MKHLFLIWLGLFTFLYIPNESSSLTISKGKQQQYFPKELKKRGVYLGMPLEKLKRKKKETLTLDTTSAFKIEASEPSTTDTIVSYTYLFTKSERPLLYQIIITYASMEGLHDSAIALLGAPNHNEEWRVDASDIKEDFTMGIWTFGQKWVYSSTLKGSEWEKGFSN
ncbi:hypothetical protein GCM10011344_35570 [Dokdonia pacifica]|uniref:Uncharacterized protein n=1 Tax=Dokdonia pacifica TaxID=1627892 RepID=A0A239AS24_9FLAO|nr:hypothetical protein [Dokdonia pacifica]GGG31552.1 hypothetical protein GCM10011344_35570 [Dokdonia pacifica]SNR98505.1 hypothetical protein SAMN06265376_105104 [Dokdonia pacifica]